MRNAYGAWCCTVQGHRIEVWLMHGPADSGRLARSAKHGRCGYSGVMVQGTQGWVIEGTHGLLHPSVTVECGARRHLRFGSVPTGSPNRPRARAHAHARAHVHVPHRDVSDAGGLPDLAPSFKYQSHADGLETVP